MFFLTPAFVPSAQIEKRSRFFLSALALPLTPYLFPSTTMVTLATPPDPAHLRLPESTVNGQLGKFDLPTVFDFSPGARPPVDPPPHAGNRMTAASTAAPAIRRTLLSSRVAVSFGLVVTCTRRG